MSVTPTTVTGRELYDLLPVVYRTKDEHGHLALYLDACGTLLDRMRATLEQRLADAFAASPSSAMPAQSWLLPYFADLLDVRAVSPKVAGRRGEVARAIAWRQRKGTLATIEEIAEVVGGTEVEVHEGWRRVAVTPRLDRPRLPAAAFGEAEPDTGNPLVARLHPSLPTVTVDMSRPARAIEADPDHPLARVSTFGGQRVPWRQLHPQGAPCFPGSFDDPSRRTPDVRTPSPSRGHAHPRRLLLFIPPATGFFPLDPIAVPWDERLAHLSDSGGDPRAIERTADRDVFITTAPAPFTASRIAMRGFVVADTVRVTTGHIRLERMAIKRLVVDTAHVQTPVIEAVDCLFDEVEAADGFVRLEGTTVMTSISCRRLQASDCLFAGTIDLHPSSGGPRSCVRFSRVPRGFTAPRLDRAALTTAGPIFFAFEHCAREGGSRLVDRFGDPAYGVLHPATPDAIRFGAEDGGEMGADHHRATSLAHAAVLTKLEEFLPLGIEAVLVPDPRLLAVPPRIVT